MELLSVTCIIITVTKVILADVSKIIDYFESDTFKTIQNHWQPERKSFENALKLILQQDYGYEGMNVYVRNMADPLKIANGFIFSDNIVSLVLLETRLNMLPTMTSPEVAFALASNYLYVEAELGRMILNSNYLLMRNQSDVVFSASQQDAVQKSPFSFQQVQDSGELTIVAQECRVAGYTVTSFVGNTVNLGLDTFKVTDCKFSLEIYSAGVGSPPVFGPYFSEKQSIALEAMLSKPIRAELMPKLQAAVFSYINTSAIFGDKLPQLRSHQNSIFKETSNYMSRVTRNLVQNTIKETQGIIQLKPLEILWTKTCLEGTCENYVRVREVTLYGLDTAYSAHIGGPFKANFPRVAEAIRFSTMQVRGNIFFENSTANGTHDFAVELRDVAVNIEMKAKGKSFALDSTRIYVMGWRTLEFSILEMYMLGYERRAAQSFITGYLINEIPKRLLEHISKISGKFDTKNEQNSDSTDQELTKLKNQSGPSEQEQESDKVKSSIEDRKESDAQEGSNALAQGKTLISAEDQSSAENAKESAVQERSKLSDQKKVMLSAEDQISGEDGEDGEEDSYYSSVRDQYSDTQN